MKIQKITIKNFRTFRESNVFNVNGKSIILYGENGYGKSSFFDAIEWCLTGEVSRFKISNKGMIKNIIANRQAANEICSVELVIDKMTFIRSFRIKEDSRETIFIKDDAGNVVAQGKGKVEDYIQHHIANKLSNKKLLLPLIKSSHILSQDQITDFVLRDSSKERFDSLADIMGYRQLTNLTKNLNEVKVKIKQNIANAKSELVTYDNVIETKRNEESNFDTKTYERLLSEVNLDAIKNNINTNIKIKKTDLINEKNNIETKLKLLKELKILHKNGTLNEFLSIKNNLEKTVNINHEKINKVVRIKKKVEDDQRNLVMQKENLQYTKDLIKEKENILKNIDSLDNIISKADIKENEIKRFIKELENENDRINYANKQYNNYFELTENIIDTEKKIEESKKQVYKINYKIEINNNRLDKTRNISENHHTSLNDLNEAIIGVHRHLEANNTNNICPVCSTEKEHLTSIVLANIERNLSVIKESSNRIIKINNLIRNLKKRGKKLEGTLNELKMEIENLTTIQTRMKKNLISIESNEFFSNEIFFKSNPTIRLLLKDSDEKLKFYNDIQVALFKRKAERNRLNKYPKNIIKEEAVESSLIRRISTLKSRDSKLNNYRKTLNNNINLNKKRIEEFNQYIYILSSILAINNNEITVDEIYSRMNQDVDKLDTRIKKLEELEKMNETWIRNSKVDRELKEYQKLANDKKLLLNENNDKINAIDNYLEDINEQIGLKASDLLNKPDSKIQKYFRYLNPMPDVGNVTFESPSSEELEILLSYRNTDETMSNKVNVRYSLSSGQLYVLAISIFLAINEEQNVTNFDFVCIDDPIQNMDDVNQFSICDVLSNLKNQLIFSTHDWEFLKLFLKKNEYKKESISVFLLENKTSSTTSVKEIEFN